MLHRQPLDHFIQRVRERDDLAIVSDQIGAPTSAKLIADAVARIVEDPGPPLIARLRARCAWTQKTN